MSGRPLEPGSPEWEARLDELLMEEAAESPSWWWLSFCDPARPKGEQFLGVAIVRAGGVVSAAAEAGRLGINPGGEVAGADLPMEPDEAWRLAWCERLLTREEAEACPQPSTSS